MNTKIINSGAFLVITDFNFLPENLNESWVNEYTDNYLIYDRAHRFKENEKIKHQVNVGANIYDIFDFIVTNYENLPDVTIFCKGNVIPRHCGFDKFKKIINNTEFTPIENYNREHGQYFQGAYCFVDENDGYHENPIEVDNTVRFIFPSKYVFNYKDLINSIFKDANFPDYTRFSPGANYIIPKKDMLKYNKHFYETMRNYVSWNVKPGEAYLLERAMFTLYNNNFTIREKYKNDNN